MMALMMTMLLPLLSFNSSVPAAADPLPKRKVIILCDLTSSIDSARNIVKKNLAGLLHDLPLNTDFEVYSINKNITPPFYKGSTGFTAENKIHQVSICQKAMDRLFNADPANQTCIIHMMDVAYGSIEDAQESKKYQKILVVILSDMQEACPLGDQFINLEKSKQRTLTQTYDQAMKVLNKWEGKAYHFDNNVRIVTVVTSAEFNEIDQLQKFWDAYFKKINYPGKVRLSATLPTGCMD